MYELVAIYLVCGVITGILSGLLGIGGGLVVVPLLNLVFAHNYGLDPTMAMRMALGTSLSSILFTSLSSARAHAHRGAVRWPIVRALALPILVGTLGGSLLVAHISGRGLRLFFVVFLILVATQMLVDYYPKPTAKATGKTGLGIAGLIIGGVSSLVGLGGGSLSVPYLRWRGFAMHDAVGTSSALALPIAIAGCAGYMFTGWNNPDLPLHSFGYINWAATLGIACASILFAPLGARLSHATPTGLLRKFFAVFLYITAVRMLLGTIA